MRRPAGLMPPGAVAVSSSFEPSRGADDRAWTPASTKTAIRDRLRRRSDSPARNSAYTPGLRGVKQIRRALSKALCAIETLRHPYGIQPPPWGWYDRCQG